MDMSSDTNVTVVVLRLPVFLRMGIVYAEKKIENSFSLLFKKRTPLKISYIYMLYFIICFYD